MRKNFLVILLLVFGVVVGIGLRVVSDGQGGEYAGWLTYSNDEVGFSFKYPADGKMEEGQRIKIELPFDENTNLIEKWFGVELGKSLICERSQKSSGPDQEEVTINQKKFIKQSKTRTAAGSGDIYSSVFFSTIHNDNCIMFGYSLRSSKIDESASDTVKFDEEKESAVFRKIMETFKLL